MIAWLSGLFHRAPEIAEARHADAAELSMLHAKAFRRGWSEDEMERLLGEASVTAHRARAGGRLVGFILSRRAADEAEILSVAVDPRWRGRGLARDLLTLHMRRLAGAGTKSLFLEVEEANVPARKLYARAGFREVGRRGGYYVRPDAPPAEALILKRDLA